MLYFEKIGFINAKYFLIVDSIGVFNECEERSSLAA